MGIDGNVAKAKQLHGSNYDPVTTKLIMGVGASTSGSTIEPFSGEKMQARPKLKIKLRYSSSRVNHNQHDKAVEDKIIPQGQASVVKQVDQYHFVLDPHVSLFASHSKVQQQQRLTTDLRSCTRKTFKVRFVQSTNKASNNLKDDPVGVEHKPEEVERSMSNQALDVSFRTQKAGTDSAYRLAHINDSNHGETSDDHNGCNIEPFSRDESIEACPDSTAEMQATATPTLMATLATRQTSVTLSVIQTTTTAPTVPIDVIKAPPGAPPCALSVQEHIEIGDPHPVGALIPTNR